MSDFDRNIAATRTGYRTDQVAIDAGLRAYMIRVYNYMASGVALTGLVAWFAYQAAGGSAIAISGHSITGLTGFGQAIFGGPLMWILILAPLGLVMLLSFGINRLSASTALTVFFVYAGLLGLSLASFLFMGLIGIVIASLVNMFLQSSGLYWVISVLGVLIFVGLTAYDTQNIKELYSPMDDGTTAGRKAVMGALRLYLDFINLFLMLLRIFGDRR
jgi:hypothetical protein